MIPKDEKKRNSAAFLADGTDVPAEETDFSLEEILAEYGAGREQQILRDVEQSVCPAPSAEKPTEETKMPPAMPPVREGVPEIPATAETERPRQGASLHAEAPCELFELEKELPKAPRPISLEEVVGSTVDAVMEEHREPLLQRPRGLFSRRRLEETEELYAPPQPEEEPQAEPVEPEMDPWDASEQYRSEYHRRRGGLLAAAVAALVPSVPLLLERQGFLIPVWSGDIQLQTMVLLGCLAVVALLCRSVFAKGVRMLCRKRCTSELLISLSAILTAGDCVMRLLEPGRSATMPYVSVSALALVFALWGDSRESRGRYDTFRAAAMDDEPPYLVTETGRGACKQRGELPGFYTAAMRDDAATLWQTVLLPVVLMASLVFAGLSSLGQGRGADFLLNWSAILASGATFALPLCWGLPFSKLAAHLQKTGCAVGGWLGAEKISRKKSMILTDADLFPPGTIQLNGVKVFGEEMRKATSYAATMARAAGSGLERLFDGLVRSEGGHYEKADDFSFFEEGGWSATIHGESVLMGTASFMRKMEVRMPGNINLKTGMFLTVDHQLIAVFAVKYNPAENVDFALRMMRRSRIMPILASRDPNITPSLLKRKFYKGVKVEYPNLTTRVALSEAEKDRGLPRALLFREGLLPYAETVAGSRRLCKAVRRATLLGLLGSAAGTLLSFYLVSMGAYSLLTPLALEVFLLLWTLPVLLMTEWTGWY
ncbi:hypothetical protein [Oscillibacter sp.]|uniref:hypothetical protein n=1 Tax=Oscillibacter sp. TaxID=1945593 RepID=UPI0026039368|nr:hypothetical protein [Oscillibacter sp.]MDD3346600.1 hypothetical protein [Oscillibacter sp.]